MRELTARCYCGWQAESNLNSLTSEAPQRRAGMSSGADLHPPPSPRLTLGTSWPKRLVAERKGLLFLLPGLKN